MNDEPLVEAFSGDHIYTFTRTDRHSQYRFGGPIEIAGQITGVTLGTRPLQFVAELRLDFLLGLQNHRLWSVPFLYGFQYSGCEILYRLKNTGWIEILELSPGEASDDFPYPNYPALLPYVPLQLATIRDATFAEFARSIPNAADEPPAELIVAVPPPATIGVSLWGPAGDAEDVTVVFECHLADRTIRAYNRCT
jgi:hypothetical protein